MSQVNFQLAERVPPCLGSIPSPVESVRLCLRLISGWQSVFRYVPRQFIAGRACSTVSWVNFRQTEYVPLCPISNQTGDLIENNDGLRRLL